MFFYFFSSTLMTTGTATSAARRQWTAHTDTFTPDWTKPRCQSWSATDANNRTLQPFDLWHTHHPNWIVTSENEDEFCVGVEPAGKSPIIRNMMFFYANQFLSSCKLVHTRYQWGSGWSADFYNINRGLIHALYYRVPCIITSWEKTIHKLVLSVRIRGIMLQIRRITVKLTKLVWCARRAILLATSCHTMAAVQLTS